MKNIKTTIFNSLIAVLTLFLISSSAFAQQVSLDFGGDLSGRTGDDFTLEVTADLGDNEVDNFDFEFEYDTSLVDVYVDSITAGPLVTGTFLANEPENGRIKLATYGNNSAITGNTVLFTIKGNFKTSGISSSGIQFTNINIGNNLSTDASTPVDIKTTSSDKVIELPNIDGYVNNSTEATITVDDLSSLNIASYQFKFSYDTTVVSIDGVNTSGTVSESDQASVNASNGVVNLAWAGSSNLTEGTELINLEVTLLTTAENSSLEFTDIQFFDDNGDEVAVAGVNGTVSASNLGVSTIAEARALSEGSTVKITGIVTSPDYGFSVNNFYIQDETAGITTVAFDYPANSEGDNSPFESGQELELVGEIDSYQGQVQLVIDSYEEISTGNDLPEPILLTSVDDWSADSPYQGMRVTLENVFLPEGSDWPEEEFGGTSGVNTVVEGNLDQLSGEFILRISDHSEFNGSDRPQGDFNITGIMGQFFDDTQLFPFYESEIAMATSNEPNEPNTVPSSFELKQNYPNPFNPSTNITYNLPEASDVTLEVYNALGQKVSTLVNTRMSAGSHTVKFEAGNLTSGVYFARIKAGNFVTTKKMLLLK